MPSGRQDNETSSRYLLYNKLESSDPLDCDFSFTLYSFPLMDPGLKPLRCPKHFQRKWIVHTDLIPLHHLPLLRGFFYRKTKNCLIYEPEQSTEPRLLPGPNPSYFRAPVTFYRSNMSLSVKVTILMENVHITTPCYFSFFTRTLFFSPHYEKELYFCHKTMCSQTPRHTTSRSHALLVSAVGGD